MALTFHVSGERSLVADLLGLLRERAVKVTAFMVGTFVDGNHDLVTEFAADGHEVANHTYNHLTFASLPPSRMTDEVVRCRDSLASVVRTGGTLFRPSGTANGIDVPPSGVLDVASAAGYAHVIGYDVDPADYADPGADQVVTRTLHAVQPGSIVSLHFGHQGTVEALPQILDGLAARDLSPVTVPRLLRG